MKVVILCGGQGTRLREQTEYRPKPMVEIGGKPILWHIMKTYAHYGFREFVICLGYRGNLIKEYFLNYEAMNNDLTISLGRKTSIRYNGSHAEQDFEVTLVDTGQDTMTGGRLLRVRKYVEGGTFLMTYGDGLSDVNLCDLVAFHRQHRRLATVTTARPFSRFGLLKADDAGLVHHFDEKPQVDDWVNSGFFVFEPGIFDYLDGDECVLEREALENLVRNRQLIAHRHGGFFYAMDTYRDYTYLNELWATGNAPWKLWV
jgi:glucose-1-phosphate cytidylyltransferase